LAPDDDAEQNVLRDRNEMSDPGFDVLLDVSLLPVLWPLLNVFMDA
jgi:hypothetical protein